MNSRHYAARLATGPATETRIDAPHALRTESAIRAAEERPEPAIEQEHKSTSHLPNDLIDLDVDLAFSSLGGNTADDARAEWPTAHEQLRRQAQELQQHLAARLVDIDRREAGLHAQTAELENQARAFRLWLREHQNELDLREQQIFEREREVALQTSHLTAAEAYAAEAKREDENRHTARAQQLDRREAQLHALKQRLHRNETVESAAGAVGDALPTSGQQDVTRLQYENAMQNLERCELMLAERQRRFVQYVRTTRQRLAERIRTWTQQMQEKPVPVSPESTSRDRAELNLVRVEAIRRRRDVLELQTQAQALLLELTQRAPVEVKLAGTNRDDRDPPLQKLG